MQQELKEAFRLYDKEGELKIDTENASMEFLTPDCMP